MTHDESAIDELAERLTGVDASLTTSIADILSAALQELIEAELTARIGAAPGERSPARRFAHAWRTQSQASSPMIGSIGTEAPADAPATKTDPTGWSSRSATKAIASQ